MIKKFVVASVVVSGVVLGMGVGTASANPVGVPLPWEDVPYGYQAIGEAIAFAFDKIPDRVYEPI